MCAPGTVPGLVPRPYTVPGTEYCLSREVGIQEIHNKIRPYEIELIRRDYTANGGWETFLSYEDPEQDILVGLLRQDLV